MYGLTRGTTTLIGVAIAGALIWLASWIGTEPNPDYWAAMALLAGAGLVLALSQVVGGWTKWGRPTFSPTVLLLAFLPTLVVAGWIITAGQPEANGPRDTLLDWSSSIGLGDFVDLMVAMAPVLALGLGLVFGLVFDTTGDRTDDRVIDDRRRDEVVYDDRRRDERVLERDRVTEEPVAAEREHVATARRVPADADHDRERTVVGAGATRAEPEHRPRRRLFRR